MRSAETGSEGEVPSGGRVDVEVVLQSPQIASAVASAPSPLSPTERERAARFRFQRDRDVFVAAHTLLRNVLGARLGADPGSLRFAANEHGRPELTGAHTGRLRFNLSHTRGLAAVAFTDTDCQLGVDVEATNPSKNLVAIADRYFAPAEMFDLRALQRHDQVTRFFQLWTLKEAYIKAIGLGLAMPLDRFAFRLGQSGGPVTIEFAPDNDDDPNRWWFAQQALPSGQAFAVAVGATSTPSSRGRPEVRLTMTTR